MIVPPSGVRVLVATAAGLGTNAVKRETGNSEICIWRWQERFMTKGVDVLVRDKTRASRILPLTQPVIERVVALTNTEPPHEATHWTTSAMAEAVGVSVSSVQRIWRAHRLAGKAELRTISARCSLTREGRLLPGRVCSGGRDA